MSNYMLTQTHQMPPPWCDKPACKPISPSRTSLNITTNENKLRLYNWMDVTQTGCFFIAFFKGWVSISATTWGGQSSWERHGFNDIQWGIQSSHKGWGKEVLEGRLYWLWQDILVWVWYNSWPLNREQLRQWLRQGEYCICLATTVLLRLYLLNRSALPVKDSQ